MTSACSLFTSGLCMPSEGRGVCEEVGVYVRRCVCEEVCVCEGGGMYEEVGMCEEVVCAREGERESVEVNGLAMDYYSNNSVV